MYHFIKNPVNGKQLSLKSIEGKNLLKSYVRAFMNYRNMIGGGDDDKKEVITLTRSPDGKYDKTVDLKELYLDVEISDLQEEIKEFMDLNKQLTVQQLHSKKIKNVRNKIKNRMKDNDKIT